jgi:hypothetical protein
MAPRRITVCSACLQASCWQAIFMCERSQTANVTQRTEEELAALGREHPDYWLTDSELARGVAPGKQTR